MSTLALAPDPIDQLAFSFRRLRWIRIDAPVAQGRTQADQDEQQQPKQMLAVANNYGKIFVGKYS